MKERFSATERIGVSYVQSIFASIGWIFREQYISDMGIDAQIEQVSKGTPTGKLFGIQIKTGESHFYITDDTLTYYIDEDHYEYWLNHSLPVLIIGYLPQNKVACWEVVNKQTVQKTDKKWKIKIPKNQTLESFNFKSRLVDILESKTLSGKINKLFLDKTLIEFLFNGGKVNVTFEDWLHKSLNRSTIKVILIENKEETISRDLTIFFTYSIVDLLIKYFPWADIEIDSDFYEDNLDPDTAFDFQNPADLGIMDIYPYRIAAFEVAFYRVNLKLNKIGKSFLDLLEYLEK